MRIVDVRTKKRTKLRERICPTCLETFGTHINRRLTCSKDCAVKYTASKIRKSTFRGCKTCGNNFIHSPSQDRRGSIHSFCSKECQLSNKKLGLPNGKYISYDGYIVISRTKDGKKQVKEHRYIMEQHLGRIILPKEIVHHINENKLDNRLENLQLVSRSEHNKIHKFLHSK